MPIFHFLHCIGCCSAFRPTLGFLKALKCHLLYWVNPGDWGPRCVFRLNCFKLIAQICILAPCPTGGQDNIETLKLLYFWGLHPKSRINIKKKLDPLAPSLSNCNKKKPHFQVNLIHMYVHICLCSNVFLSMGNF